MSVIFLHKTLDTTSYSGIALTTTPTGFAAAYPSTNLQDQYFNTVTTTDAVTADQEWRINLGATYACDSALFLNHNFTTAAADVGIKLQHADNSAYTTNLVTDDADVTTANGTTSYTTFNSATKQYWRLFFNSTVPLGGIPYIGQIFLGTKFTHAYNHTIGNTEETGYEILKQRAWDGTDSAYLQYSTKRKFWGSVRFQIITSDYKTNFDTFFESVKGGYRPFMMSTDSGTTWYYVRVAEDKIQYINKGANYWETTLNFYEQIT